MLPLLQQSRWHRKVRYGYAGVARRRNYVNNVRQYYQSLLWLDNEQQKAHRRETLDEDDGSEPAAPAERPAIIAEVSSRSSPPEPCRVCLGKFSVTILPDPSLSERGSLQYIHQLAIPMAALSQGPSASPG